MNNSELKTHEQEGAPTSSDAPSNEYIVEAAKTEPWIDLKEIWDHRYLLWLFVRRDLNVQYRQTVLGIGWAVVRPVMILLIFTLVFGILGRMPRGGYPYPVFLFPALVAWQYFSRSLSSGATALTNNSGLLKQIYFPRILTLLNECIVGLVDFLIASVVFIFILLFYDMMPSWRLLLVPIFMIQAVLSAIGFSLILSGLDVRVRDLRVIFPTIMMFWMYLTPIIYDFSAVPRTIQYVMALNPMTGVVQSFRWASLEGYPPPDPTIIAISIFSTLMSLLIGQRVFNRNQKTLADFA